ARAPRRAPPVRSTARPSPRQRELPSRARTTTGSGDSRGLFASLELETSVEEHGDQVFALVDVFQALPQRHALHAADDDDVVAERRAIRAAAAVFDADVGAHFLLEEPRLQRLRIYVE